MAGDAERLVVLLEARIRDFEKNMKKASGTADRSYNRMRRQSRSATRQMEADMVRSTSRINRALASTSNQIGVLGRTFMTAFAGGIFAGGLVGLQRGVRNLVSEMSKIADTAKMVGMSSEDLQRLRYAFEETGVAADQTDAALRRFARRIGEAANGGGQLYDVLKANNVQLRNADGSMRSQIDLFREYARLIQNAGSHQDRLTLAFKAFDVAGAAMVQGLTEDFDGFISKIDEAGGAIEDELIQRASEIDTRWERTWRRFETNAKSAILSVITAVDTLGSHIDGLAAKMGEIGNSSFFRWLSEKAGTGDAIFVPGEGVFVPGRDELSPSAKVAQAFAGALQEADAELVKALQQRYGQATKEAVTTTIIPPSKDGKGGSRNAAARAAIREAEAVERLIESLSHELSLIGKTDLERAKSNALRQAGSAATEEQRRQIEALVEAIHTETEAHRQAQQAAEDRARALENLFHMASDGLVDILDGSDKAKDAVKRLAAQLAVAAAQAALLGTGPLAGLFGGGLFGGGGGGLPINYFPPAPVPGFASGTANTGGRRGEPRGIVHGQEAVIPLPSSGKVPVQLMGGSAGNDIHVNAVYSPTYNVQGSGEEIAALRQQMAKDKAEFPARVVHTIRQAQKRRAL